MSFQAFNNVQYGKIQQGTYYSGVPTGNLKNIWYTNKILAKLQQKASEIIYPTVHHSDTCTIMILSNLAEPYWMQVSCQEKLSLNVLCVERKMKQAVNQQSFDKAQGTFCQIGSFSLRGDCYLLLWCRNLSNVLSTDFRFPAFSSHLVRQFSTVFEATSETLSPLLFAIIGNNTSMYKVTYKRFLNTYKVSSKLVSKVSAEGFLVSVTGHAQIAIGGNMLSCENGSYISSKFICDGNADCPSGIDENNPSCRNKLKKNDVGKDCGYLFYKTLEGKCCKFSSWQNDLQNESGLPEVTKNENRMFDCSNGKKIKSELVDDLMADCGPGAEDESMLSLILLDNTTYSCNTKEQIPCHWGHSKCYNISNVCNYELDSNGNIFPCRNGAHLHSCMYFECNIKFKCIRSYCIPWSYVCDGKLDCPTGNDEDQLCGKHKFCSKMYKCELTSRCVHLGNVCDNKSDCPFGDEELFCELHNLKCPSGCKCLLFAIECNEQFITFPKEIYPFIYVNYVNTRSFLLQLLSDIFPKLRMFSLLKSEIGNICHLDFPTTLLYLDAQFNDISSLTKYCFKGSEKLKLILLEYNNIYFVQTFAFALLLKLRAISLSNNPIITILSKGFCTKSQLIMLSIRNVSLLNVDKDLFGSSSIKIIVTSDYRICCLASAESVCIPKIVWYAPCSDTLPSALSVLFILISVIIVILSTVSMVLHFSTEKLGKSFTINIYFINVCDIACSVYFFFLWITDLILKNKVMIKENDFRDGIFCFLAFTVILWFSLLSQTLVLFLGVSRLMVVIYPMKKRLRNTQLVTKCLFFISFIYYSVSVFIASLLALTEELLPLKFCFPFIDPTHSILIITTLVYFIAVSHFLVSISILMMNLLLYINLKKSQKITHKKQTNKSNAFLIMQLAVLMTSNFLCWCSQDIIYITLMYLPKFSFNLILWTIGTIMPINSIVYPIVLISAASRKLHVKKQGT